MVQAKEIVQISLTKVHLILMILVLAISLVTPIVVAFITISTHTENLIVHDKRITVLEQGRLDNRELLLELKFNLKKHMNDGGEDYIDNIDDLKILMNGK